MRVLLDMARVGTNMGAPGSDRDPPAGVPCIRSDDQTRTRPVATGAGAGRVQAGASTGAPAIFWSPGERQQRYTIQLVFVEICKYLFTIHNFFIQVNQY